LILSIQHFIVSSWTTALKHIGGSSGLTITRWSALTSCFTVGMVMISPFTCATGATRARRLRRIVMIAPGLSLLDQLKNDYIESTSGYVFNWIDLKLLKGSIPQSQSSRSKRMRDRCAVSITNLCDRYHDSLKSARASAPAKRSLKRCVYAISASKHDNRGVAHTTGT
jgi:hypothetical protein